MNTVKPIEVKLTIFDETLRDGEQQVGIFFDAKIKQDLAKLIVATGVHYLALMPEVHHTEAKLVKSLVDRGWQKTVAASTMMGKDFIDRSYECGVETIILFNAVSDRLLALRDCQTKSEAVICSQAVSQIRQRMLDKVLAHLSYARSKGLKICFAAEDASRADFDFLVECINKFHPYIEHFILCDTVGILTPEATKRWIHNLVEFTDNQTPLTVHFHNDRGLALENTLQAVRAGAMGISGTFGGIGERAGNVAIEQVLNALKFRYGWQVEGINYNALANIANYLAERGFRANPPYSPASLRYETGIHVDSLLRDRQSYYLFDYGEPEIWFGKFSGASNFKYLFEHYLNQPRSPQEYQQYREIIKAVAIEQKRSFSTEEVLKILKVIKK